MRLVVAIIIIFTAVSLFFWSAAGRDENGAEAPAADPTPLVEIVLPDNFSADAQQGQVAFDAKCAACHGTHAVGQDGVAPPLVHKIYEPSHHGDEAFQRAVSSGVRQHHWPFGNMPPVEGLTRADVAMIVAYVRALQRANGIE